MSAHSNRPLSIHLRPPIADDVQTLFEFQLDPVANELAGTKPRDLATFRSVWDKIVADPIAANVTPRVIIADKSLVGIINIFPQEDTTSIGYWLDRPHWGRGIATRSIALLIAEVPTRPLYARVAEHNTASLRALEKNGFAIVSREYRPGTDRYTAHEVITLTLT